MKTLKKLITIIIIILSYSISDAQQANLTPSQWLMEHKKQIGNTPYIFEGTVMQKNYYSGKKQVITTCIIQITKIFKGSPQLKVGTIKVITMQAAKNGDVIAQPSDGGDMIPISKGGIYIIFCRTVGSAWCVDSTTTGNTITLTTWGMDYPVVISDENAAQWYGTPQFKTKEDIYAFFKANGLTVEEEVEQK